MTATRAQPKDAAVELAARLAKLAQEDGVLAIRGLQVAMLDAAIALRDYALPRDARTESAHSRVIEECAAALEHLRDKSNPGSSELWAATVHALKNAAPQATGNSNDRETVKNGGLNSPAAPAPRSARGPLDKLPKEGTEEWLAMDFMGQLADEFGMRLGATMAEVIAETRKRLASRSSSAHTDHPPRHWDRTCPACIAEVDEPTEPETHGSWEARCAALYQVIGCLASTAGIFSVSDDVSDALDVAAGRGDVDKLLPWPKDAKLFRDLEERCAPRSTLGATGDRPLQAQALNAAIDLIRECVEGRVEDAGKWNRQARAFLATYAAGSATGTSGDHIAGAGKKVEP